MAGPKGFKVAKKTVIKRLILSVEGQEREGKTTFALSAPGPIALLALDPGLERVIEKWVGEKKIYVAEFDYRDVGDQNEWRKMWRKMWDTYMDALNSPEIRTVVVDTFTEAYELQRLAAFGQLSKVMPHQYAPVNAELRDMVRKAYKGDKNLILLHKMKEVYQLNKKTGDDSRTGDMERAGWSKIGYEVQAELRTYRDENGFGVRVRNCRHNADIMGEEYGEPVNDFVSVAMEMVEGSEEGDWK